MDAVIISGGSSSGVVMLGRMHKMEVEENIVFEDFKTFGGTSIGAVISFMMLIGYKSIELTNQLADSEVWGKLETNFIRAFTGRGFFPLDLLREELKRLILLKLPSVPKFKDLKKNFICCTFNLSKLRFEYFGSMTPEVDVIQALMMSCALPIIFEPVNFEGDRFVDGGIGNNFPLAKAIEYFDCKNVLGIYKAKTIENKVENDKWQIQDLGRLISSPTIGSYESQIESASKSTNLRLVKIESKTPFIDFKLTDEKIWAMFQLGLE